MNGAESLVRTLLAHGIDTCFANPGTSEMHFVAALDQVPGMHCVLGLFEGVVTGAADGYARIAGKPAATLLHCGPGLANGLANLHNARRAHVPILNIVGDHATYHRPLDAPLTADTEGWARPVSAWTRTGTRAETVGADAAAAIQAAMTAPGGIATLILPSDVSWDEGGVVGTVQDVPPAPAVDQSAVDAAAAALRRGEKTVLLLADGALRAGPLATAHRIAAATGARIMAPTSNARVERGRGRHPVERVPYVIEHAIAALKDVKHLILVGAAAPVGFFAYPGKPGMMQPADAAIHVLARPEQDLAEALTRLADTLKAPAAVPAPDLPRPELPGAGAINPENVAQVVAALLPDDAIVVDESISYGRAFLARTAASGPHDWLQLTGGAIGAGLPLATGAAIAGRGRRVVTLQADGSALYTVQALWTQAREKLDVTTVILSNRKYAILLHELANVGANPGRTALDMLDLGNPSIDWTHVATGFGVEAAQADKLERLADLLAMANKRPGPFLIELLI